MNNYDNYCYDNYFNKQGEYKQGMWQLQTKAFTFQYPVISVVIYTFDFDGQIVKREQLFQNFLRLLISHKHLYQQKSIK